MFKEVFKKFPWTFLSFLEHSYGKVLKWRDFPSVNKNLSYIMKVKLSFIDLICLKAPSEQAKGDSGKQKTLHNRFRQWRENLERNQTQLRVPILLWQDTNNRILFNVDIRTHVMWSRLMMKVNSSTPSIVTVMSSSKFNHNRWLNKVTWWISISLSQVACP